MKVYNSIIILFSVCILTGCLESSFNLSDESRMPAWLEIPEDISREDLSVTLDFYTSGKAVFTLYRKQGYAVLDRVVARVRDKTPLEKDGTSWPMGALPEYPLYVVVTFNGISEIVEKKKDGPVIHITDEKGVIVSLGCIQDTDGGYDCSVD